MYLAGPAGDPGGVLRGGQGRRRGRLAPAALHHHPAGRATSFFLLVIGVIGCVPGVHRGVHHDQRRARSARPRRSSTTSGTWPSQVPDGIRDGDRLRPLCDHVHLHLHPDAVPLPQRRSTKRWQRSPARRRSARRKKAQPTRSARSRIARTCIAGRILTYAILIVGAIVFIGPWAWMVVASFKNIGEIFQYPPQLDHAQPDARTATARSSSNNDVPRWFLNSAFIALSVTFLQHDLRLDGGLLLCQARLPGPRRSCSCSGSARWRSPTPCS